MAVLALAQPVRLPHPHPRQPLPEDREYEDMSTPAPPPQPLTPEQHGRLDLASASLDAVRGLDLVELPKHQMIILVERLRSSLDDTIRLVKELSGP